MNNSIPTKIMGMVLDSTPLEQEFILLSCESKKSKLFGKLHVLVDQEYTYI